MKRKELQPASDLIIKDLLLTRTQGRFFLIIFNVLHTTGNMFKHKMLNLKKYCNLTSSSGGHIVHAGHDLHLAFMHTGPIVL